MDYEKFKETFPEDLKNNLENLGHNIEQVEVVPSNKLNIGDYDALTVRLEDYPMGPSANLTNMFEAYEQNNNYEGVLNQVTDLFNDSIKNMPTLDVAEISNYESIKDKLVVQAVNIETNAQMLENIPHKNMEDIAICYRAVLGELNDGKATVLINNKMMEQMGISEEQLHSDAIASSQELRPPQVKGMFETIKMYLGMDDDELPPMGTVGDELLVATVEGSKEGAGVIAYENFMDDISERVNGDFYMIPCSVHEVIIVPEYMGDDIEALKDMISKVNSTELRSEDVLSDNLYHYDSKDKVFEIADKYKERMAEKEKSVKKEPERESAVKKLKKTQDKVKEVPKKELKTKTKARGGEAL